MSNPIDFQKVALETLEIVASGALGNSAQQIDDRFSRACEIILKCKRSLQSLLGMGKLVRAYWPKNGSYLCPTGTPLVLYAPR